MKLKILIIQLWSVKGYGIKYRPHSMHKIFDTDGTKIFEGESEDVYEFILKHMSSISDDYMMKYINYKRNRYEN